MPTGTTEVFADTSALYALLVAGDGNHAAARQIATALGKQGARLVSSSFVVLESVSLLQSRAGIDAVRLFRRAALPLLEIVWVDGGLLERAMSTLLAAGQRRVSLTDWTSFAIMHERSIRLAFAFDEDFARQGFELLAPD